MNKRIAGKGIAYAQFYYKSIIHSDVLLWLSHRQRNIFYNSNALRSNAIALYINIW